MYIICMQSISIFILSLSIYIYNNIYLSIYIMIMMMPIITYSYCDDIENPLLKQGIPLRP